MHTLVLDLYGGLPGLGAAELLVYGPRAEGRLSWLLGPALVRATDGDLARLAEDVRAHLTRRHVGPWQCVPLLDLPAGGDPLDGSALTDQLDRLQRLVLAPLGERGMRPQRTVAISLDGLARDHRGVPTNPAARLRWKLDTYGMALVAPDVDQHLDAPQRAALNDLATRHPALLNEREVAEVGAAWVPLERPDGVRLDQRLATLTPELRATLDRTRGATLDLLARHLGLVGGESASDEAAAPPTPADAVPPETKSRFRRPAVREAVRDRFAEDIDALQTFSAWQSFDPAGTLRRIVQRQLSLEAVTATTTVLRFQLVRQPLPALRRSLLDLAYVVVALADAADQVTAVKPATRYAVEVEVDESHLAALAEAYRLRLDRAVREVGYALDEPLVDTIPLVRDPNCGCDRSLDVRGRFATVDRWNRVGPVRGADDLRWDAWATTIDDDLRDAEAEADAHIAACVRADAARFPRPQPHRIDPPIEAFLQREREAFREQQRALLASLVPDNTAHWERSAHTDAIAPRLYSRPVGRVAALWTLGAGVVFGAPYLAEALATPTPFAGERAAWLGGLVAAGLLVALGVLLGRWLSLRKRWRAVALVAKEALASVQARYRLRTERLAQGCALRAARQRVEAATVAEAQAGQRRLQLRFHATQLQHHQRLAETLRDDLTSAVGTRPSVTPSQDPVPPQTGLGNGLDPALPVYANAAYHLTHRPGPPSSPSRLIVNRSEHDIASPRLAGLEALRLTEE